MTSRERLIDNDLEQYLMGQVMLKDIAAKRNLSLWEIRKLLYKKIEDKNNK